MKEERTLGLEVQILDLLSARHQLCVDVELATSPRDEMAVLQANWSAMPAVIEHHRQPESQNQG